MILLTIKPFFTKFEIFMLCFIGLMICMWLVANIVNGRRAKKKNHNMRVVGSNNGTIPKVNAAKK